MAQCFNPNGFTVNGMGVAVAERPMPTEEQQLRDTLDVLRNSLRMMEDEPDLAAECAQVRAQVREVERRLGVGIVPAGTCPVCGLSLTEHPHSEADCMEWFAEDYADQDQTIRDLLSF